MNEVLLTLAVGAAATLYSSVGHGGASAYIAILTLAGKLRPEVAATILLMNIGVSSQAWFRFRQSGHFDAPLAGPLLLIFAPAAFAGAMIATSRRLLGIVLAFPA
jgi:uncharacterized membrane protein YfcA